MDLTEIKQIVDLMAKNEISFFQLEREGASLQLRRGHDIDALKDLLSSLPAGFGGGSQPQVVYGGAPPAPAALPAAASAPAPAAAAPAKEEPAGPAITSPMVGTFYLASSPGEQPFVKVGQHVDANTTVCIIEAMKVMNEIKAETSGTIARVIAQDGKPVQYGQPLFQLK
jgi:acetyl-CoA carboxylase biotin carboxyl carrier protein